MSTASTPIPPPISWAQRNDLLYVIIDVECKDIDYKVTDTSFFFKGVNVLDDSKKYEVTLTFLHPVDPQRVTSKNIGRCMEFTIYKREAGPYWPTLTCLKTKLHFLKANFTKWKNESDDESDAGNEGPPFESLMNSGGMGGMGGWNNKFDDFNVDEDDSDDNIPSLSQNDEEDDDDDDGPKKDDKEKKPAASSAEKKEEEEQK